MKILIRKHEYYYYYSKSYSSNSFALRYSSLNKNFENFIKVMIAILSSKQNCVLNIMLKLSSFK